MFQYLGIFLIIVHLISTEYQRGPYEILIKQIGHCADEGAKLMRLENGKIRRKSKSSYTFNGDWIFETDQELQQCIFTLDMAAMGTNGVWKEHNYYLKIGPFCSSFKLMMPKFLNNLMKSAGLECSKIIPKGNYTIKNVDINIDLKLPIIPYNKYKIDAMSFKNGKKIACFQFIVDVVPKKH